MLRRSLFLVTLIGIGFVSSALAHGPRLVVRVDEPFEVRGRLYPPGSLTLRSVAQYNPAMVIDEVRVGTECIGLLMAEKGRGGRPYPHDAVIFERNTRGRLVLVGYVLRSPGNDNSYRYRATSVDVGQELNPDAQDGLSLLGSR